ncbi:hypothetical protein A2890_02160 [candidate division WWE3 bacterium RIFCSPLOWO2_01_FULL_53_14]|uniref:Uncharacterized protein n=1 Tax=candidate division WWE3 bacterium RIFCSPLOWO2_01_FULL_53_14 TaxID=1802628 RepID=A0A1F4VRL1_UNCKA|nr:MAG: hypothetical protein A2890_02160 [candidate division WWE3 bacterium RIFCSPLOWO2_01_FULL_53_14]
METQNQSKFNPKFLVLVAVTAAASLGLGFSLENIFAGGFSFDPASWMRFAPLLAAFLMTSSLFTVISLTATGAVRALGVSLSALALGLPFMISPNPVEIPLGFAFLVPLAYAGSLLFLDYLAKRAVKIHTVFEAGIFSPAYSRFFQLFVFAVGILVYFSAQLVPQARLTIPEGVLAPALNLVVNQVINQVQNQLGNEQFTEEQFLTELEKTGVLKVLEEQYGILLNPQEISTPKKLAESLRQPLAEELTRDLEGLLEPYLPFLPLATAVGVALSLLFLTPIFAWASVGVFALVYRILVALKFASFERESREVPVLKIS